MTYWFTSDLHLGHEKVAELRGFPNVRKHDTVIIDNLLRCLNSGDKLFVLGDVSLGRKVDVSHAVNMLRPVAKLVGYRNMSLVRGNHDPVSQWATQGTHPSSSTAPRAHPPSQHAHGTTPPCQPPHSHSQRSWPTSPLGQYANVSVVATKRTRNAPTIAATVKPQRWKGPT